MVCQSCHGHNGDNAGTEVGKRHMDGVLWGGGKCNSCHWYDTDDADAWTRSTASDADLDNNECGLGRPRCAY